MRLSTPERGNDSQSGKKVYVKRNNTNNEFQTTTSLLFPRVCPGLSAARLDRHQRVKHSSDFSLSTAVFLEDYRARLEKQYNINTIKRKWPLDCVSKLSYEVLPLGQKSQIKINNFLPTLRFGRIKAKEHVMVLGGATN